MPTEITVLFIFTIAAVFFILGAVAGTYTERGVWEYRIQRFAAYLEKTTVPLKIEKDVYHTVATALRLFSKKRYN